MERESGVFKRGTIYWISYTVGHKQHRESAGTSDRRLAQQLLAKRRVEVFEGRFFPQRSKGELTVEALRDLWLEAAVGKRSLVSDRLRFPAIVSHFGAATRVSSITGADLERFKAALRAKVTHYKRPMSVASVNRYLALLRSSLRLASARGFRHQDPMAGVRFYPEHNERDRICEHGEYERLIASARAELRLAIVFGYWTGMRLSEITGLRWEQIDVHSGVARLSRNDTKTSKAREVPLSREVLSALATVPRRLDGRVFRCKSNTLSQTFRSLCVALAIEGLHFHDLRHTAITNMRRAGVDLLTIQAVSGHRTLSMLARYNTINLHDLRNAVAKREDHERDVNAIGVTVMD